MEQKYYIYEWFNKNTGEVFYIGKGCNNRYSQITGRNKFFIDYYNTHDCESRIIIENLSEKDAYDMEIKTIKWYKENTNYRLTNQTDGGEGHPFPRGIKNPKFGKGYEVAGEKNPFYGKRHIPRVRKILSEKAKNRTGEKNPFYNRQHSEETKQILREKAKKRIEECGNPMSGRNHSEESKRKMSEQRKGKKLSEETKRKISEKLKGKRINFTNNIPYSKTTMYIHHNKGRKHTEETRKLLSSIRKGENNPNWRNGDKIKGENNPMYGKTHSEDTKKKMQERAKNRAFDKICLKCNKEFIAKAHNTKYCPECKPRRKK